MSWIWYTGGWDNAAGNNGREQRFLRDATRPDGLPAVSFIKPIGAENEHPGYASETLGNTHLVDLLKTIVNGPNAKTTMIIVTYDEFGGQLGPRQPTRNGREPGPA